MPAARKVVIAIVGAGKCSKKLRDMAADTGRYIAQQGAAVVCGGLGGVMEGASRGAREGGGVVIGILPGEDRADANEFVDFVIPTGFGEARNIMVVRAADAVIAFPGKYGTLSEMAFALKMKKPLVSVGAWRLGDDIPQAEDPVEAARMALALVEDAK